MNVSDNDAFGAEDLSPTENIIDAESEEDEALAVDRAYVLEAAEILLDYAHLQETQRFAAKR